MFHSFPYYMFSLILALTVLGNIQTGFLFILVVYVILPFFDEFLSFDQRNPDRNERQIL